MLEGIVVLVDFETWKPNFHYLKNVNISASFDILYKSYTYHSAVQITMVS